MKPAFEITEEHCDSFDPFFVSQVFEPFLANFIDCDAVLALLLRLQIEFLQFVVREREEIPQFVGHVSP